MYPLVVQYFAKEEGIKIGLLDFYEDANETSESISRQIEKVVHKNNLDFANISSFAADNASVNFGKNVSVYEKLKAHVPNLIKANCKCHILHNCVKYGMKSFSFDMELLVLKVFSEFSAYAKRTKELKSFFDFVNQEYKEVLRHVATRWLSLLPALERLLNWPALRSYFVSQGEDECSKIIWEAFKDEEEESYAQMVCLFLQNIMQIFSNNIKLLGRENTSSAELHEVMTAVRKKIIERKEDQYFGKLVMDRMKTVAVEDYKKEKFRNEANSFLDKCISYLEKWYDFDKSSFKFMGVLSLKQPVKWDDLTSLCENLKIDLDMDKLYDDFCLVREVQTSLC
jgi:hypothetical protein